MICQTLVYQVSQVVPSNVDGGEGPVLPTEEWAESEILKSSQGWIRVSKNCLVRLGFLFEPFSGVATLLTLGQYM